jgi:hypothetical protein
MRGAHNLWYVYARPAMRDAVAEALRSRIEQEKPDDCYDFESVLDECGFRFMERLENPAAPEPLWQVQFH